MIGCYSHRLNLAVKKLLSSTEHSLSKVNNLINNLCILKQSAISRERTDLRPVIRSHTRWSTTFNLSSRYFDLKPYIDCNDAHNIILLLALSEEHSLKILLEEHRKFESVYKILQEASDIDITDARNLFDFLLRSYPELLHYLGLEQLNITLDIEISGL